MGFQGVIRSALKGRQHTGNFCSVACCFYMRFFQTLQIPLEETAGAQGEQPHKKYGSDYQESEIKHLMATQTEDSKDAVETENNKANSTE